MRCPYCGKEMELGYIQCRDGVRWSKNKFFVAALSGICKSATSLKNGASDNSSAVYAYKCSSCKKVIIDYGGNKEDGK